MWYNFIFVSYYYLVEVFLVKCQSGGVKDDFLLNLYTDGYDEVIGELGELRGRLSHGWSSILSCRCRLEVLVLLRTLIWGLIQSIN